MRVAVIGGGAMGAAASWRLAARGVDVICFDRLSPPHASGSSHGESRIIRTAYFEGSWYVPLLQEVFPLWRELEAATGREILTMTGALMIGDESSAAVSGALDSAREHDLDVERLDTDQLRRRYPGHVVREGEVAVLDRQGGILRPEAAVEAMLSLVPTVERNTIIESVDELLGSFDAVVVAAGPWTSALIDWLPLQVERQAHAWLAIDGDAELLAPERFPVFIRETHDLGDVYGFPTLDGISVKVARHHLGEPTDADHIRREVDDADIEPLRRVAATYLHGVGDRVTRTVTCMYTNTPDGHFVIDFSPTDQRVVVISACSGHGFKFAPIMGDIAADLVCDGVTARDIARFSARRFSPSHVPGHNHNRDQ